MDSILILDSIRGELTAAEAEQLEARLTADPALRVERDRIRSMLIAEQTAQARALDHMLDSKVADRIAARILDRSRRESDRHPVVPGRQRLWARLLAVSVAVHVVAFGVLSWRQLQSPNRPQDARRDEAVRFEPRDPADGSAKDGNSDDERSDRVENMLPGPYVIDVDALPIDEIPDVLPLAAISRGDRLRASFPQGLARAVWVRTTDSEKRRIEARVGSAGSLDRVKAGLAALAPLQHGDGSFEGAEGHASIRATAMVVLAFLSDGHSSAGGEHRAVVERGVGWLFDRAEEPGAQADDRALALFALSEDVILSSGSLTPAQVRVRRGSLVPLAESVRSVARDSRSTMKSGSDLDSRWTELALVAASRAGLISGTSIRGMTVAATMSFDVGSMQPGNDARTAMLDGTSLLKDPRLKDRRGAAFTTWNAATARALSSRLGADGIASGSGSAAARAEETALILLALEVAYRTY